MVCSNRWSDVTAMRREVKILSFVITVNEILQQIDENPAATTIKMRSLSQSPVTQLT